MAEPTYISRLFFYKKQYSFDEQLILNCWMSVKQKHSNERNWCRKKILL